MRPLDLSPVTNDRSSEARFPGRDGSATGSTGEEGLSEEDQKNTGNAVSVARKCKAPSWITGWRGAAVGGRGVQHLHTVDIGSQG